MPELPEIEVTRRGLAPQIEGARIAHARLGKPLRWPLGVAPEHLHGQTVRALHRRGKYLLFEMDRGWLLVHLGMSGSLRFGPVETPPGVHDHFDLQTSRGLLRLHDPRRFGAVVWADSLDHPVARKLLGGLGVEPLSEDFSVDGFVQALTRRSGPIKPVIMAGDLVVGVGNIYASEALFMAGISPVRAANRISRPRVARLHGAIREVLAFAVAHGGSTLRDFVHLDGHQGYFQLQAQVYGREGQPCRVCGKPVRVIRQAQRSTFYCVHCQK